ncbi:hypothetical protein [Sphingobium chungbukense]|uniref:Uncharacterized protein n=1 Tax=Sphingobium chungbukense TaxID=56193 RepID=A0A0M3AVF9_9SPHN|nr:hypothetical protein [Sphingobium chungbukense]KKW93893.1 hypothetical protein YP76_04380 [Sphingobium chungbukense]
MSHDRNSVGTAFAEALRMTSALMRDPAYKSYQTVDFVNIGRHAAGEAHRLLPTDPEAARYALITGASRMLAAAERLENPEPIITLPSDRPENAALMVIQ